jgi:oxygen-dependent protoporphyrinogen oxidase
VTLTSYLGGSRAPELAGTNDETLITNTLRDLHTLLGVTGAPTYQHCFVFNEAIPQYNVGYGRFKDLMAHAEAAAPGLLIGGHCRSGISLGDSIVSGYEMAKEVQKYLSTPTSHVGAKKEYASLA